MAEQSFIVWIEILGFIFRFNMSSILAAEQIQFSYGDLKVLQDLDLVFEKGSVTGILGPNGSGKSTLIKILAGILKPDSGRVLIENREITSLKKEQIARKISVVPQDVIFHFPFRVFDFVMMGRHPYQNFTPFETLEDHKTVNWALEVTDLSKLKERSVLELSGGEKQRTILASALAQTTPIMFLDEPTASLDLNYQVHIHQIIADQVKNIGLTVVIVTHDLNLGALYCKRLVMMKEGRIVADGTPKEVCNKEIVEKYYGVKVAGGINEITKTPFILPIGK